MATALLNSGSLKLLKLAPARKTAIPSVYGSRGVDGNFILSQPQDYLREALKRGFAVDDRRRVEMVEELADLTSRHSRLGREALAVEGPISDFMVDQLLGFTFALDAERAARVAPVVAKMMKAALKSKPDAMAEACASFFVVHEPAAAGEHVFKAIVAHALLGTKKPAQTSIEHKDMEALAASLFSTAGRKALREETGGLEAWLAGGHLAPPKAIADLEGKRRFFQPPGQRRRRF